MTPGFANTQRALRVRKLFRPFADHYEVLTLPSADPIGYVHRLRGQWRAIAYTDGSRQRALFAMHDRDHAVTASSIIKLDGSARVDQHLPARPATGVEITDQDGALIGTMHRGGGFGRAVWRIEQPGLNAATGREASRLGAFLRGVGGLFRCLSSHYTFTIDDEPAFRIRRHFGYRTRFSADIADARLDRRLVVAAVIQLD